MTFFCVVYWLVCFMPHLPSNSYFYSSKYLFCLCVFMCSHYTVTKNLCTLNTGQMIGYLFFILPSYMISTHYFKIKRAKKTIKNFASDEWRLTCLRWWGSVSTHECLLITCSLNWGGCLWHRASYLLSCSLMGTIHQCPSFMWVCNSVLPSQQARGLEPGWFSCNYWAARAPNYELPKEDLSPF